jgi:hypothetical protein
LRIASAANPASLKFVFLTETRGDGDPCELFEMRQTDRERLATTHGVRTTEFFGYAAIGKLSLRAT